MLSHFVWNWLFIYLFIWVTHLYLFWLSFFLWIDVYFFRAIKKGEDQQFYKWLKFEHVNNKGKKKTNSFKQTKKKREEKWIRQWFMSTAHQLRQHHPFQMDQRSIIVKLHIGKWNENKSPSRSRSLGDSTPFNQSSELICIGSAYHFAFSDIYFLYMRFN